MPDSTTAEAEVAAKPSSDIRWLRHGIVNTVVVLIVVFGAWYLFIDPQTSFLDVYPLPANAAIFWGLMFIVWAGFNLEFTGFARLPQPLRGLAILLATLVFAVAATWFLGTVVGHVNPDFAAERPGGVGYFVGALFVLFGFSTFVMAVLNWEHWPFTKLGMKQPVLGWSEIAFWMVPTIVVYVLLGIPTLSTSLAPGQAIMGIDSLLGWYYTIVVAIILTGLMLENLPWALAGSPAKTAVAAVIGNVILATVLFYALRAVAQLVLGPDFSDSLGGGFNQYAAQLGVCWNAWMILWANGFGNIPTHLSRAANMVIRTAATFLLAVGTFAVYYHFAAEKLLHEPEVGGGIFGNALGFMDLFILVTLLYVVGFGSYPFRRPDEQPSEAALADEVAGEPTNIPRS